MYQFLLFTKMQLVGPKRHTAKRKLNSLPDSPVFAEQNSPHYFLVF